jgi:hypothetical protein
LFTTLTTLTKLQGPTQVAHLFRAEDAIRRRCALVASRLELAASALVLLEVACHADAALDDLDSLANARGIVLETASSRVRAWVAVLFGWIGDLWPASATRGYQELLGEMRRNLALASTLRASCVESGDRRMADWCALWTEQRAELAERLSASLASDSSPVV